jgi:hypothetical protein
MFLEMENLYLVRLVKYRGYKQYRHGHSLLDSIATLGIDVIQPGRLARTSCCAFTMHNKVQKRSTIAHFVSLSNRARL